MADIFTSYRAHPQQTQLLVSRDTTYSTIMDLESIFQELAKIFPRPPEKGIVPCLPNI